MKICPRFLHFRLFMVFFSPVRAFIIFIIFNFSVFPFISSSQNAYEKKPVPVETTFQITSNYHWNIPDGANGFFVDYLRAYFSFRLYNNLRFAAINESTFEGNTLHNDFPEYYVGYSFSSAMLKKPGILTHLEYLDLRAGRLRWFPKYSKITLFFSDPNSFIDPASFSGLSLYSRIMVIRKLNLKINIGAISGDVFTGDPGARLYDLNVNWNQRVYKKLGFELQVGISQGSQHVVNWSYAYYEPKWNDVEFTLQAGKLPGYDESPYGMHVGLARNFNFIRIGGFYERRVDQHTRAEIAGITWGFIGNSTIAKIFNTFQINYDFNTNTVWVYIPVFSLDLKNF